MTETTDITLARLDDQLTWYDRKAARSQRMYKRLKAALFIASGLIPVSALCPYGRIIAASLGFLLPTLPIRTGFSRSGSSRSSRRSTRAGAPCRRRR